MNQGIISKEVRGRYQRYHPGQRVSLKRYRVRAFSGTSAEAELHSILPARKVEDIGQSQLQQELLLTTKLQPPASMGQLVPRPRLLQRLEQGHEGRLTLVCAPAGSGKTTLVSQWSQESLQRDAAVVWVSLDEGDNDPQRFWRYVCATLEHVDPRVAQCSSLLKHTHLSSSEAMLVQLMNLLIEIDRPFTLVLDDYHLITSEAIHRALAFLLEYMPEKMHLVLLTRFEPPLPLGRLRVRGQIIDIGEAELRFTPDEVNSFCTNVMGRPLAPVQIQALTQRTEGWVAGLQLAALAMRECSDPDTFLASFTGSSRYIVDYLLEEVIGVQAQEVQTFLLYTAVLERMSSAVCDNILALHTDWEQQSEPTSGHLAPRSQAMLEYLERTNLFLIPLDQERHWYRYHHLFAQALRARLELLYPMLVPELYRRASTWFAEQGLLIEANTYAKAAQQGTGLSSRGECEKPVKPAILAQQEFVREPAVVASNLHVAEDVDCKHPLLFDSLSEREVEVLQIVAAGATNNAIAHELLIAPMTVKRHLSNIFSKLGVANRTQAVAYARELGIL